VTSMYQQRVLHILTSFNLKTWLLGTGALGAIVTLLVLFKDGPLKKWTPDFRLATVIAALSQVAQSSL
jgi:hypothetical protein